MGEGTLRLSNLKADVGAELWLMQSSLDEVRNSHYNALPSNFLWSRSGCRRKLLLGWARTGHSACSGNPHTYLKPETFRRVYDSTSSSLR